MTNENINTYFVEGTNNTIVETLTQTDDDMIMDIVINEVDAEISEDFNEFKYSYLIEGLRKLDECAVTFIKKDGTERTMKISHTKLVEKQEQDKKEISEGAKKAAETRKKNHPNLLPVYDIDAGIIKSINLDTLSYIKGIKHDKGIINVRTNKQVKGDLVVK